MSQLSKLNYVPFGAQVVVRLPDFEEKTKGGVIKSEAMLKQEKESFDGFVEVLAAGENCRHAVPGQAVLLKSGAQMAAIQIEGEEYWQIDEFAILGKRDA